MSNRNEFQNYIDEFDRTAFGAGSQKDPAKDRFSAQDVGRMFSARGDVSGSDAAQMVLDYADDARRDGASMGGGTERALDKLRGKLNNDSGSQVEVESETPSFNEAAEAEFSPQVQGAIERSNAFRERALSGQTAQDIFGKSQSLAKDNTLGIVVGDPVGGVPQQNKAMQAADSETARYFDTSKWKLNLKQSIQENVDRRLNLM